MKAVTFAAAAAVISAVSADDWSVDPTTTTSDWTYDPTSTTTDWSYDPTATSTTTDWSYDPTTTTTDWSYDPTTTSTSDWSYDPTTISDWMTTTTTGDWYDPATTTTSWSWDPKKGKKCTATVTDWALGTTTSTTYVTDYVTASWDPSWKSTSTVYVTVTSSAAWSSSTTVAAASTTTSAWSWAYDPAVCAVVTATSTGAPVWDPVANWTSYSTVYVTPVEATSTWADWTSTTTTTTTTTWADWTSTATSSSATATYTGSSTLGGTTDTWAMTYSPYTASSGCKDQGTIAADIAVIASKGFTSVRIYSTDCKTLEYVGAACRTSGLKMILGVFISSTGISGAAGQVSDIIAWAQWDLVELIVVGNEAVFNGYCSASDLAWFIGSVGSQVKAAGYTGPLTTTEPLLTWQTVGTTFCSAVDVVAANLYAFFNAATTADMAGAFIQSEIDLLGGICSGKDVYVMETGWPSAGNCNGIACPSVEGQATAITGIQATSGAKVVFFSYEDDLWKEPGPYDVEQHWGCASVFPNKW